MTDLLRVVDDFTAAWSSHDRERVMSFIAEDVVFVDATVSRSIVGAEDYRREIVDGYMDSCPDCYWTPVTDPGRTPIVMGNAIAFESTFGGTNTGDWADGTPATGKAFKIHAVTIFRFNEDGKIVQYVDYIDYLAISKDLGWYEDLTVSRALGWFEE